MRQTHWTGLAACAALSTALGCNAIWGIPDGEASGDPAAGGAGSSGSSGGAGAAASAGSGAGGGGGGAAGGPSAECPFEPFTGRAPGACQAADGDNDYLSDPENCCVPGRSCLGGACEEGRCLSVVLATANDEEHEAIGLVVDGDGDDGRVLWASGYGNTIFATEKAASGSTEPLVVLDSLATLLARSESSLLITDETEPDVYRMPLTGNVTVSTVASAQGAAGYRRPVAGGGWVYWITGVIEDPEQDPDARDVPKRIWAAQADATAQTGLSVFDRDTYVGGLALDATHLYWTDLEPGGTHSTVRRMALGEPGQTEIVASIPIHDGDLPGDIAVGERIFWISGYAIYAVNKDGTDAGALVATDFPTRLLADSTFVYWYSREGQLQRVRTSGGAPEPLADSADIRDLAQDCGALYWTTWATDERPASVIKLAK
ncbi:hypothetical protein WMF45_29385 [Sorangium sp. So ce448]|uniref:hypothetical protein n=1 Tax=Sorangium sp. So ce448 TaxID=3133314 RepID=UPI003F61F3BA